ncbi:hypothetical protein LTR78_001161 [Recurvomyces mirabilis]|uniref:NAD(P)-binding domain-containing protein n=1 Tax=Recurvomyces mirabilis TaxID=574656 RepID=A0AAE0WVG8_9PEZI|nr:hypothetical protein LTR78_001161 [Recurvomyces mirabilis]KAK5161137.1 hypothetical protein LTS14_000933 [Recurvomyces mirabilis]
MTSTFLLFGGSGKVARHITKILASEGHTVHSIIRSPDQKPEIEALGGKPIVQSIEESTVQDFTKTIKDTKASIIIWSAGAGGKGGPARIQAVDCDGAIKSMDAATQAGVKRYIMVSAFDVRDREGKPEPEWYNDADRARSDKSWGAIGAYYKAKFAADRNLVTENGKRGLQYTIVRPGGLSEEAATGKISAGKIHISPTIPREDVARAVVEVWKNDATIGLAIDMVGGGTPIKDAIAEVAKGKVDTFEGRY